MTTELSDLELAKLQEYIMRNNTFRRFMSKNQTKSVIEQIQKNKKEHRNLIIEFLGETGTGKSYSSIALGLRTDPNLNVDKIVFTMRDLIESAPKLYNGKPITLINDEQIHTFGIGSYRIRSQFSDFLETIRKKEISIFRNSPTRKFNIDSDLSHFIFVTFGGFIDKHEETNRVAICDNSFNCLGFVEFDNPAKTNPKLIKAYEKKKDAFLNDLMGNDAESTFMRDAKKLMESHEFNDFLAGVNKVSREDLFNFVDYMRPELRRGNEASEILSALMFCMKMGSKFNEKLYR